MIGGNLNLTPSFSLLTSVEFTVLFSAGSIGADADLFSVPSVCLLFKTLADLLGEEAFTEGNEENEEIPILIRVNSCDSWEPDPFVFFVNFCKIFRFVQCWVN